MKQILKTALIVIFGNFCYALAVAFFIEPAHLITGGGTGIALFVHHLAGVPTSVSVFIINTSLFLVGWKFMGRRFAANTLLSTFCLPIEIQIAEDIASHFVPIEDIVLCTVFGGLLIGASLGIVIRTGASTGGMDIPPIVLNKVFGVPISKVMWCCDLTILAVQAIFTDINIVLYGIILVVIYTMTLDKVLILGKAKTQIKIVSKKSAEIRRAILQDVDRGVTVIYGRSGYLGNDTEICLSIVSTRELAKAEKVVHEIDPEAFIIVSRVSEVKGRGFSSQRKYIEKAE
ncbi:MAG: YitT family protein [Pseudobutyrivibrio sp.]|nr:YitT family protein [Pseudobutyrivibrio sp.]